MQNLRSGKSLSNTSKVWNNKQKQTNQSQSVAMKYFCSFLRERYDSGTQDPVPAMLGSQFTGDTGICQQHLLVWHSEEAHMLWGIGMKQTRTCSSPKQNTSKIKEAKDANSTDGKKMSKCPNPLFAMFHRKPQLISKQVAKSLHSHVVQILHMLYKGKPKAVIIFTCHH